MSRLARHMPALLLLAWLGVQPAVASAETPTVTTSKTPGGLAFRHVRLPSETHQVVSFSWRDGTAVATHGRATLPQLAKDLLDEGPRGLSGSAYAEELEDLQATISLSFNASRFTGQLSAPPEQFADAAALIGRVLSEPALPARKLDERKKSRAERVREGSENAETLARRLFAQVVFGANPHTGYLSDDDAQYDSVTMLDIETWHRKVIARDNLLVATAGPLRANEIAAYIDRMFAALPGKADIPIVPKPVITGKSRLIVLERTVPQTAIVAGDITTIAMSEDYVRADLLRTLIKGEYGSSSGLTSVMRERLGATYDVEVNLAEADAATRFLGITALVGNEKIAAALAGLRSEYARFFTDGVPGEELEAFKRAEISSARELFTQSSLIADQLLTYAEAGFPEDYLATYEQRVRAYTPAEVAAELKFFPKALTIVIVAPSAEGLGADCVIQAPEEIARCQ